MTNCELKNIIEIEIGIFGLLLVVGLTRLKKRGPGQLVQFSIQSEQLPCENRQASIKIAVSFCMQITLASIISQPHDQPARLLYCRGRALLKGRGKNPGAVKSSPIFRVPLAQQPALQLIYDTLRRKEGVR
jgi:hypothetical protein